MLLGKRWQAVGIIDRLGLWAGTEPACDCVTMMVHWAKSYANTHPRYSDIDTVTMAAIWMPSDEESIARISAISPEVDAKEFLERIRGAAAQRYRDKKPDGPLFDPPWNLRTYLGPESPA